MINVSVVIPVFNGAKFIAATVRSVLRQTYKNYEIIIVNDGSTDNTLSELFEFGESIRIISILNGGVSNARNVGIEASKADYIAFLDADDLWNENKLSRQMKIFDDYSDVGLCCCNYVQEISGITHFDLFVIEDVVTLDFPMREKTTEALINSNFVGTCSNVILKKTVLNSAGLFNTSLKQAEDYDLWIRCSSVTNFFAMSDVLMSKVTHGTNLTNNQLETWQCHEKVLKMNFFEKRFSGSPHLTILIKIKISEVQYHVGDIFYNSQEYSNCFRYYLRALRSNLNLKNILFFSSVMLRKATRLILEVLKIRRRYKEV